MSTIAIGPEDVVTRVRLPRSHKGGWFQLDYHPAQSRLWRTSSRNVLACAGRGSGKTLLARRRVVRMLRVRKPWRDPRYFYGMPTYGQCHKIVREKVLELIPRQWLTKVPGDTQMEFKTVFGSWLFLVGMDAPQRVEGDQYDGGVMDECSDQRPGIYEKTLRPALTHRAGWLWRIGVPKRYGIGASEFKAAFMRGMRGEAGHESHTWPSADFLSAEEIREVMQSCDEKTFEEQYGGKWVDAGGGAFYAFDPDLDVGSYSHDPNALVVVGCDFNVSPMAWVLCHIVKWPDGSQGLEVFDEVWLNDTNTKATLDVLWRRYGHKHRGGWLFIGDAAGQARKTSASESDYKQILNDRRFRAKVRFPAANPRVRDRLGSCNALFCSASGERRCKVDRGCVRLIEDLTARTLLPTGEPDDKDPNRGHITDALGYPVHKLFPLTIERESSGESIITTGEW